MGGFIACQHCPAGSKEHKPYCPASLEWQLAAAQARANQAERDLARYKAAVSAVLDKRVTPHPMYCAQRGRGGAKEVNLFYGKNIGFNEAANLLRIHLGMPAQPLPD
jgi:hypothetical protein